MAFFPAFGAAFGGGPFGAMGAPAPIVAMELIPSDEQDRVLYELDKACGVGKAMRNPELAKHLSVAQETAEKPLTKIRELLKPYRKSEDTLLDSVSTYRFRVCRTCPARRLCAWGPQLPPPLALLAVHRVRAAGRGPSGARRAPHD